ncbi:hypothetical protein [Garicola koreensis]|uniref:Uncharacterized protein n=1 Tax=Garicola koreensis TaxID=1262554 RepID=A0A7W5XKD6_9MICC|nr:hypothetical protein [Garicola koreensis]MBB3666800.1 hypothetical protein [Garicola koreensis]
MRYIYAAITLLLGLLLLGLGIGQLSAESEETRTVQTQGTEDAPFTVVTDDLVDAEEGFEEFTIEAEGEYSLAVGRTFDVEAWIGDAAHNRVTGLTEAEGDDAGHIDAEYVDGETQAPNPSGSDLWAATETAEGDLLYRWSTPDDSGDWSLLIFRDGEQPAPAAITIEQVQPQSQAGGIALVIGGSLVLLISLGLFYWASTSRRRPRDSDGDTPEDDQPGDGQAAPAEADAPASKDADAADTEHSQRSDFTRSARSLTSALTSIALAAGAALGLAGPAHAENEPTDQPQETGQSEETDQPEETDQSEETGLSEETGQPSEPAEEPDAEDLETETDEDVDVDEEMSAEGYSMLLSSQLDRILTDISDVVEAADAEQDSEMLEERVAGAALTARQTAYRNQDAAQDDAPAPVGTEVLSAAVSSNQEFPRQAMVITEHPDTEVPQVLVLQQQSARENYQLVHTAMMAPGTEFPSLSTEQGGTEMVDPQAEVDGTAPVEALSGMAEYFTDADHDFGSRVAESTYIDSLHQYHQDLAEAADDTELNFPDPEGREGTTALQLPDGSTVVAGSFEMRMQMAPLEDGDTIFLEDELIVDMLGTDWTTFPTEITTLESVVVHLPAPDSEEDAVLLGVDDIILDATIETPEWFDGYDDE